MGHSIGWGFLQATTKEAALREGLAIAEEWAHHEGDSMEGSDTYHGRFRFFDKIFDTEDDALDFFMSLGPYDDGVVIVKEASRSAQSKYHKTMERLTNKQRALIDAAIESFKKRTSETVGCKKCGHRISKDEALQHYLRCPKCGKWLVPNSIQARYYAYEEAKEQAGKQLARDTADTGKPRYFAKYCVHC